MPDSDLSTPGTAPDPGGAAVAGSSPDRLGTRTVRGVLWSYGSYAASRLLGLAFTAVLARLLVPEQFGVVALALVFISLLETLADLGLTQALVIAKDEVLARRSQTAFWWTLALAAGIAGLTAAAAPVLADLFDEPALAGVLPALGVALLVRAVGATHYALVQRSLEFRARTLAEVADVAVRGAAGVALALLGFGVWSLVLGYLAGAVAFTLVLWAVVPWRPSWRAQREPVRASLRFGGTLTVVSLLAAVISNADYLVVGRVLGAEQLGLYSLGFKLPELVILNVSVIAGRVLFPAFAAVETGELARTMLRSVHYTLLLCLPLAAGLAVLAEPLTLLLFGPQWAASAHVMQILTVYALAVTVGVPAGTVLKSTGRAGILLWLAVPRAVAVVVLLVLLVPQGLLAVAWVQAGVALVFSLLGMGVAARVLQVSPAAALRQVWQPALATGALALAAWGASAPLESPLLAVLAGTVAGAVAYAAAVRLLAWSSVLGLVATGRRGGGGADGGAGP